MGDSIPDTIPEDLSGIKQTPSYLTRQAHKHHSMKKKFVKTLFCQTDENQTSCAAMDSLAESLPASEHVSETIHRGMQHFQCGSNHTSSPLAEKVSFTNLQQQQQTPVQSTPLQNKSSTMESFFPSTMKYWQQLTATKPTPFKKPETQLEQPSSISKGLASPQPTPHEFEQKLQEAVRQAKQQTREEIAKEQAQDWHQEHAAQLKQIKENYQRQLNERKDTILLMSRQLRTKEVELEHLEQELKESNKELYLKTIQELKADKDELKLKLQAFEESQSLNTMKPDEQLQQVQNELQMEREVSMAHKNEIDKLREQLEKVTLQHKKTVTESEQLRSDIEVVTYERDEAVREYDYLHAEYLQRSPDSVKDLEIKNLREQIIALETQRDQVAQEHAKALQELKQQGEDEMDRLKDILERRMAEKAEKEQELQAKLSDSSQKEELLERIEALENEKRSERSGGLVEVQKKEDLLQKIQLLERREKSMQEDHEKAMRELRENSARQVQELRIKLEDKSDVKEREYIVAIQENSSMEKEELVQKIDSLQTQLGAERKTALELKMKLESSIEEQEAAKEAHLDEMGHLKAHMSAEIERLKVRLESTGIPVDGPMPHATENELREVVAKLENELEMEREQNVKSITELNEKHKQALQMADKKADERLEKARAEAEAKISSIRQESENRIKDYKDLLESAKNETEEQRNLYTKSLENETKFKKEIETLNSSIKYAKDAEHSLKKQISLLEEKLESDESAIAIKLVEEELETSKKVHEEELRALKMKHSKELDEILSQLDLVEKEQKEKLDKLAAEKDNLVNALSSQLAKAIDKLKPIEKENANMANELKQLRAYSVSAQEEVERMSLELKEAKSIHENFVKRAEKEKEEACKAARDEMIEEAEAQFRNANGMYVKLKKQYDMMKSKAERFENQVKKANEKADDALKEKDTLEYELRAELAELKASSAKAEADAVKKAKESRAELGKLLKTSELLEKRCEEAEMAREELSSTISDLKDERDSMRKTINSLRLENQELTKISEDLMAELEAK